MNDKAKYKMTLLRQREDRELASMKPLPDRITAALNLADLYGPEVDRMFGGEEPMVDQWEAGTRVPTPEQIRLLADLAGVTPGFFVRLPEAPGGPGVMCTSDGCVSVWLGPPARPEPVADVVEIFKANPSTGEHTGVDGQALAVHRTDRTDQDRNEKEKLHG